ncbi:MAG: hypothetical protein LBE27_01800 [Deltaproteobacteria bacterium]|nr:hypothetical protein [Deltaproteobacteria bacterium]
MDREIKPESSSKDKRRSLLKPALGFLILGLVFLSILPDYRGFYLLSFLFSLVFFVLFLPGNVGSLFSWLKSGGGFRKSTLIVKAIAFFLVLLALGSLTALPVINLAAPKETQLNSRTLALLQKIDQDISLQAYVGDAALIPQAQHLLGLYSKNQPRIKTETSLSYGKSEDSSGSLEVARQNTVLVSSGSFRELVSPLSESAINASLLRLLAAPRLIYNLQGEGERSATDASPRGLSLWSSFLEGKKVYVEDYFWNPSESLPKGATVMIIGPRMPLDEEKELALKKHLGSGGKALLLLDPLVASVDPSFLESFGLMIKDGLVVDPDSSLAGTESVFVIIKDLPAHPVTLGLSQPVMAPITGAIMTKGENTQAKDAPLLTGDSHQIKPQELSSYAKEDLDTGGSKDGINPAQPFLGHTWALAQSGKESFLETDLTSIRDKNFKMDQDDPLGPLSIACATSLEGGGKMVLVADSDLASNAYISYAGNAELLSNMLFWLEGAEDELGAPTQGFVLTVDSFLARVFFFIPVIIWPLAVLGLWGIFYIKRQKRAA